VGRAIHQVIAFDDVSVEELFETYADDELHAAAVGAPARILRKGGGAFTVFGDSNVRGTTLYIDEPRLIVQRWRAAVWQSDEPDSILVLQFNATETGSTVELFQSGVPDRIVDEIDDGWHARYWRQWMRYFDARRSAIAPPDV
jgi:activator of HSP90 ATPase